MKLIVSLLTIALLVSLSTSCKKNEDVTQMNFSSPSKFGLLTSSRWAYGQKFKKESLTPVKNTNPNPEAQPNREHPYTQAITQDGKKLYIALTGSSSTPGSKISVFDVEKTKVIKRIEVGSSPMHLTLHPGGRFLVVLNRFSNFASVIDVKKDKVVSEIALDFYCQRIIFNRAGTKAYVSNRYLNQVFVVDIKVDGDDFEGTMQILGGFDDTPFLEHSQNKEVYNVINSSCGTMQCHANLKGNFYAGSDATKAYFSAMENATPGQPESSLLLKAVLSDDENGFADDMGGSNFHAGGLSILKKGGKKYSVIAQWIKKAQQGPGIPVGNFGSKPRSLALSTNERYLYVGNLGTQDISIIDLTKNIEIGGIYTQNVITDLNIFHDKVSSSDFLIALSLGLGFGAAKERDPVGGESLDSKNPAAQYTVHRNIHMTTPLTINDQKILGRFDATDNTAAFKMSDIQNDVILVDTSKLDFSKNKNQKQLDYLLKANKYESHREWVRYTSDSAEILHHDISGDIPPELQRVVGAFPESIAISGDKIFTVMLGSYELVQWQINPRPVETSDFLEPIAVYKTGIMPRHVVIGPKSTPAEGKVFVSNYLGETISIINLKDKSTKQYPVGDLTRPFPDSNSERGEMFVNTTIFSVDQDTSCMSCHIYGTSDARSWGAGQAIAQMRDGKFVNGGLLGIPQIRNLFATQPFYFEGTHTAFDAQFDDAREHVALHGFLGENVHGDFTKIKAPESREKDQYEEIQDKMSAKRWDDQYEDLKERRDEHIRKLTTKYFGKAFNFRDFQRFIGEYQASENGLRPNPFDQFNPSVIKGKLLFNSLEVGCISCHKAPEFTDKSNKLYNNNERTLPALISFTPREQSFTIVSPHWMDTVNNYKRDVEYWDKGRVEKKEGNMTTFPLRGLFDRPFAFLHHGRAKSIRESFATPNHYSLRKFKYPVLRGDENIREDRMEKGFNELSFLKEKTFMMDTHGGTSHLNATQVQDLENFLLSIE